MTGHTSAFDALPEAKTLQALGAVVPDGPSRILAELERDAQHLRRMSVLYLICAMVAIGVSALLTIILASRERDLPATGAAISGGASVVGILLGGRRTGTKAAKRRRNK